MPFGRFNVEEIEEHVQDYFLHSSQANSRGGMEPHILEFVVKVFGGHRQPRAGLAYRAHKNTAALQTGQREVLQ